MRRSPGWTPPLARARDRHALLCHVTPRQVLGWSSRSAVSARGGEQFSRASLVASTERLHRRGTGPPAHPGEKAAPNVTATATGLVLCGFVAMPILAWSGGKERLSPTALRGEYGQLRTRRLPGLLSLTSPKCVPRTLSAVAKLALRYLCTRSCSKRKVHETQRPRRRADLQGTQHDPRRVQVTFFVSQPVARVLSSSLTV